ncbi:enoyl-CoA hydratase/isomerase family protein [Belnapia sp. T18]|uniref:Enoyl-CoA hydratase/isomerase family protein n=1 Tax=Belnapia arida TaxID=2804533 RepID=A0ABS1U1V7_9PROT|nr:enoyl-CoA hydratase-related protein [Belnapia arida]MBL6078673.1 enoyl-CoA hydratase/isomerase family protein [Belnapia arida]
MSEPVMRIVSEREGGVLVLTLDQPARRNALAMPLRVQMIEALRAAQGDKATRAIVVTGAGGHFCSGGDISGMDVNSAMEGRERMRLSHELIRLMVLGSVPVVAAIEGYCVGAGLSIACASDTVVAAEDARLGAGFGKIGLMADLGLPHTLPLRVGQGKARQVLLYHNQMTATEAERIGLIDHVVPKGHALATAMEKARFLAEQAPAPMALTKQMLGEGLDRALEQERHFQATLFMTHDFAEGRAAFLGKRAPAFKGD